MTQSQAVEQGGIETVEEAVAWCQANRVRVTFDMEPAGWPGYEEGQPTVILTLPWNGATTRGSTLLEAVQAWQTGYQKV